MNTTAAGEPIAPSQRGVRWESDLPWREVTTRGHAKPASGARRGRVRTARRKARTRPAEWLARAGRGSGLRGNGGGPLCGLPGHAAGTATDQANQVLAGGQPEGEEEGSEDEAEPEPFGRLSYGPSLSKGHEHLPGEREKEADANDDGGADTGADVARSPRQQAQVGATGRTPLLGEAIILLTDRADQR